MYNGGIDERAWCPKEIEMIEEKTLDGISHSFGKFYGSRPHEFQDSVNLEFMKFLADFCAPDICFLPIEKQEETVIWFLNEHWPDLVLAFLAKRHGEESVQIFVSALQTEVKENG